MEKLLPQPGPAERSLVYSAGEIAPQQAVNKKRGNDHARAE